MFLLKFLYYYYYYLASLYLKVLKPFMMDVLFSFKLKVFEQKFAQIKEHVHVMK